LALTYLKVPFAQGLRIDLQSQQSGNGADMRGAEDGAFINSRSFNAQFQQHPFLQRSGSFPHGSSTAVAGPAFIAGVDHRHGMGRFSARRRLGA
jgi:hypothetical protein